MSQTTQTTQRHSLVAGGNRDLLHLLAGLAGHHRKTYCYPSYQTIAKLYRQMYHRPISFRTIARHCGRLEAEGLITRQRRHYRDRSGQLILRSTLYRITTYAARVIASGVRRVRQVLDYFAVPRMAQHLDPLSSHPPPWKERAPCFAGGARASPPVPVDKSVDNSVGRQAIEEMRRLLADRKAASRR
jgi:hypothetical protein